MKDTIETQTHYMLAVEHITAGRLELWEAIKDSDDRSIEFTMQDLDSALVRIILDSALVRIIHRVRM